MHWCNIQISDIVTCHNFKLEKSISFSTPQSVVNSRWSRRCWVVLLFLFWCCLWCLPPSWSLQHRRTLPLARKHVLNVLKVPRAEPGQYYLNTDCHAFYFSRIRLTAKVKTLLNGISLPVCLIILTSTLTREKNDRNKLVFFVPCVPC